MKVSFSKSKKKVAGFIISLEFILVMALVVFPLMVGMVLLGRKMITLYLNYKAAVEQPMSRPVIWDSSDPGGPNNKPVGPVVGYDQFSSPLVLYRDASLPTPAFSPNFKPGILLGVRPNRFTTTSKVYYLGSNCNDAFGVAIKTSSITPSPWPNVGFLAQLQGMNYAVGNGNILYREGSGVGSMGFNIPIHSVWSSDDIGDASPATGGTACQNLGGATLLLAAAADDGNTPALVTAFTTTSHFLNNGDTVTIGGVNEAGFNITAVITRISATSFTYVKALPQNPGFVYNATFAPGAATATVPAAYIPNLVRARSVADLDAAPNFLVPYRVAFPVSLPGAPLVSTGG